MITIIAKGYKYLLTQIDDFLESARTIVISLKVHVHRPPAVTLNKTPEEFHISTGLR